VATTLLGEEPESSALRRNPAQQRFCGLLLHVIEQQETASIPGCPAQSLGGFGDIGARKSRPHSALAPSSKNKPIFKK
jgi:hypothetical protein